MDRSFWGLSKSVYFEKDIEQHHRSGVSPFP